MKKKVAFFLLSALFAVPISNSEAAMDYPAAANYQIAHKNDIWIKNVKCKDVYGEKNIERNFSFIGKEGLTNIVIRGNRSFINLLINYGFENIPSEPYAYIDWWADLAGNPEHGFEPKKIYFAFTDGTVVEMPIQGYEYHYEAYSTIFGFFDSHTYSGKLKLNSFDLYDLSQRGELANISIDTGNGEIKNFFYSGDKNKKQKQQFDAGLKHALDILEITPESVEKERKEHADAVEAERLAKLRAEVEAEIKAEAEKEAMKQQILAEMANK